MARFTHWFRDRQDSVPVSLQKRIQTTPAPNVEIHVNTSKVVQDEISYRVGAHDRVLV